LPGLEEEESSRIGARNVTKLRDDVIEELVVVTLRGKGDAHFEELRVLRLLGAEELVLARKLPLQVQPAEEVAQCPLEIGRILEGHYLVKKGFIRKGVHRCFFMIRGPP